MLCIHDAIPIPIPIPIAKIGSFIICLTSQVEKRYRRRRGITCWTLDRHLIIKISNVSLNTKHRIKYSKTHLTSLFILFLFFVVR